MIEDIIAGRTGESAEQAMIKLGVAKLPEISKDNTDRNRTSPLAFTGAKFEFRAVGSSQSIAFPVMIFNAVVAEAIGELAVSLRAEMKKTRSVDDAVLRVVKEAFKDTTAIRFEGNNYAPEWVKEAGKRGLLNLRRSPEALDQINVKSTKALFATLGILTPAELESRYHVRVERYLKDMLIEMHTMREMIDTMVLPASYKYLGVLADAAQKSKAVGIKANPATTAATAFARQVTELQKCAAALRAAAAKADTMHHTPAKCAQFLTSTGAGTMQSTRAVSDAIELTMGDEYWPLPRYREMVFPV
jgi:glutamine synthetase